MSVVIRDRIFRLFRLYRWSILVSMGVVMLAGVPSGCTVSPNIVEIEPPQQPPLQRLDENLNYEDPDAGEANYVRTE